VSFKASTCFQVNTVDILFCCVKRDHQRVGQKVSKRNKIGYLLTSA